MHTRQVGNRAKPRDRRAHQHRHPDPQTNQVTDRKQRKGQVEIIASGGIAVADAKVLLDIAGEHLGRNYHGKSGRGNAANHDR